MSTHPQLPAKPISITGVGLWKPISLVLFIFPSWFMRLSTAV